MPDIILHTKIKAPIERCFDLSRSIDLHKISTEQTKEEAVHGVTSGLIDLNETVTWKAVHFGVTQTLTTKITEFKKPDYFVDEMIEGIFHSFRHEHLFIYNNGITIMTDHFTYRSPLGVLGELADFIFLKQYMTNLLSKRNSVIKDFAEGEQWKQVLR